LEAQLRQRSAEADALSSVASKEQLAAEKGKWDAFLERLIQELEYTRQLMKQLEEQNKQSEKILGATRMQALQEESRASSAPAKKEEPNFSMAEAPPRKKAPGNWPAWVLVQQRTFTRWCNSFLVERMTKIEDFEVDFDDGVKLCQLVEIISGQKLGTYKKGAKMRAQKLENVSLALKFLQSQGIKLVGIGPEDVVDPKLKLILGLIWTIILRYQIQTDDSGQSPKAALLAWVNKKIGNGTRFNSQVGNFKEDWQSGKAIVSLVEAVNPGQFNLPGDLTGNALRDTMAAFDKATRMGIPDLLLPEDMVDATDELSNMTYISYFRSWEEGEGVRRRVQALRDQLKLLEASQKEQSDVLRELAHAQREIFADRDIIGLCTLISGEDVLKGTDKK